MFILMTTAFGIYVNELTLRYNSVILAAWVHGVFNAQKLGVWSLILPVTNPLMGGYAGLIGIAVWFALGMWQVRQDDAARAANPAPSYADATNPAR